MLENVLLVGVAFALGGVLKGATGAGAPLLAIPILALLYDVPTAITLFSVPNLVPNVWQTWRFRGDSLPRAFWIRFAVAGGVGAALGTYILANVATEYLLLVVAMAVVLYILFRLARPDWVLAYAQGLRMVLPVGLLAGMMQGSGGISAPVSITFLNAMKLDRGQFIATISVFFTGIAVVQIPLLAVYGFLTLPLLGLSVAALVVVMAFMPVGTWLVRHVSRQSFDRLILVLLGLLSVKMFWQVAQAHF